MALLAEYDPLTEPILGRVGVVCVCGECHRVQMCVNDVFCPASLSGTMRSAISVQLEKTASVIFLMLVLWSAIFSMAKGYSAERTILVVRMLVNTWDLKHMMLWNMDLVS